MVDLKRMIVEGAIANRVTAAPSVGGDVDVGELSAALQASLAPVLVLKVSNTRSAPFMSGDEIHERIRIPQSQKLIKIVAKAITAPTTSGTYELKVGRSREGSPPASALSGGIFDLTSLVDGAESNVPLTGTASKLSFIEGDELFLAWVSTDPSEDLAGSGLTITAVFELQQ